jgi:hypothetical protein
MATPVFVPDNPWVLGPVKPILPPTYNGPTGAVQCLTGCVRSDGTAIFQFQGLANRALVWSITTGSGLLQPYTVVTDQYGRANARYDAQGFSGPLVVTVQFAKE